jgi:hypothetical protein
VAGEAILSCVIFLSDFFGKGFACIKHRAGRVLCIFQRLCQAAAANGDHVTDEGYFPSEEQGGEKPQAAAALSSECSGPSSFPEGTQCSSFPLRPRMALRSGAQT